MRSRTTSSYIIAMMILVIAMGGCAPTYPKEKFKESIIRLCKTEYKVDVKVRTIGKTVAIYLPLDNLMDFTFALTPSATDKINDVIMSVTRVVLSTDANYDFYCIIAHDVRIPEIQVIIIKYVDDVRRVFLGDISRGEFGKRMIVDMRLNPQSQKERSINEIFEKMNLDPRWQDQVMNDFFRSEPTSLGDIGYWGGRFYIKDITLPEFLAEQIFGRIRIEFRETKQLSKAFLMKAVKAEYKPAPEAYFKVEFLPAPQSPGAFGSDQVYDDAVKGVLQVASDVIHGYDFNAFDYIEILNQADGKDYKISRDDLEKFRTRKVKFEQIVK